MNSISLPPSGESTVKKSRITPQLLLGLLAAGAVELELWGEQEPAKLVGVGEGETPYALAKVWNTDLRRETIELVPFNEIKEVRASV
ncbi:hypothetical protein CDES_07725 [Corynebacterium deserti GIMN1.010]|uniref:Uncharacterized protein n=1 Tax=Corynebacterium deserti GIMN1.010 TaxID=931089 RepID=A0A0M4CG94_9CORY|nr:hypothetical protein [Corynebacterium deserti]ALC05952.1 hypothetical protein CDES_07725 [Corynebacterium deserti GIMN1.010]